MQHHAKQQLTGVSREQVRAQLRKGECSGIRFVTPSQRHGGHDVAILAKRVEVYRTARRRHPNRWSRGTRNWTPISTVRLNPEHGLDN